MNLLTVYTLLQEKELTINEAAQALKMTPVGLKQRITKHGTKLPTLLATLDQIAADQVSREEAAKALGVSIREVNFLMKSWKVVRPIKPYLVTRTASKVKWEVRKKLAIDFISGATPIEEAAEFAGVSERQMRRWVSNLVRHHYGMFWKELVDLPESKRRRIASELEVKEGLELSKQQALLPIYQGNKTVHEEALDRVIYLKRRRRGREKGQ